MLIAVRCECGRKLFARPEFAGTRAECPDCGAMVKIPDRGQAEPGPKRREPEALEVTDFFDPPTEPVEKPSPRPPVTWASMAEALLDPRSIHWMLVFGGGVCVLGLVIYLTSLGLFKNVMVLASALIGGTVAVMAAGWAVTLNTKYRTAGRALTFLACVVAPLNLWFLHAQGLVTLSGPLWVGGLICSLVYVATVVILRDPLFLYAVEGGVTLTVMLFLYSLGLSVDATHVCLTLVILGLLSIHAERAFAPDGEFNRQTYGLPLFWSGQAQLAAGLLTLLGNQLLLAYVRAVPVFGDFHPNLLMSSTTLAGVIWALGAYGYLYSDVVVRKLSVYMYAAAFCLLAAAVTVGIDLDAEVMILLLAAVGVGANIIRTSVEDESVRWSRALIPLGLIVSFVAVLMGVGLHWRATSTAAQHSALHRDAGWLFVMAMLVTAVSTRVSGWLVRKQDPGLITAYFALSAASAVVAAAGLLRTAGLVLWVNQAPILMLLPLGYLIAARAWRGREPEQPLGWAAHGVTAVILFGLFGAAVENATWQLVPEPTAHFLYAATLAEATLFYALAAIIRRRSANVYFAAATACLALWQLLASANVSESVFTMLYAALGCGLLFAARGVGLEPVTVYGSEGRKRVVWKGKGQAVLNSGNAILLVAILCAVFQGLSRLAVGREDSLNLLAQFVTAGAAIVGAVVSLEPNWRRAHITGALAVAGVSLLTLMLRIQLRPWEKVEIVLVVLGLLLVVLGYVGRFREHEREDDGTSLALWVGSLLCTVPLLVATLVHRLNGNGLSLPNELGLVTICAALLLTGVAFQVKASTFFGAGSFSLYVLMLIITLGWQQQWAVGAYLALGGGAIFLVGLVLSMYRDHLLSLPERLAKREGVFKILNWR